MKQINGWLCFSLRTAGLIIGWLGTLSFVIVLECIALLAGEIPPELKDFSINRGIIITFLLLNIINGLTCVALLRGIYKENEALVMPWIVFSGVVLGFAIIGSVIVFIVLLFVDLCSAIIFLISCSLVLAFAYYTWCAIYSLRRQIIYNKGPTALASIPNL